MAYSEDEPAEEPVAEQHDLTQSDIATIKTKYASGERSRDKSHDSSESGNESYTTPPTSPVVSPQHMFTVN